VIRGRSSRHLCDVRNPPHVHQPLIQTIVDELGGHGECPSTGESAARTSRVLDECVRDYYGSGR
jgi:1,5-anhydro-D-fructose reductase (1,5-anhydro-D-mannitol-forming)